MKYQFELEQTPDGQATTVAYAISLLFACSVEFDHSVLMFVADLGPEDSHSASKKLAFEQWLRFIGKDPELCIIK